MAIKTKEIPVELRTWWKFFQVASYRHDYARVFSDWVTMTLAQFVPPGTYEKEFAEAMAPYDRKEKDAFGKMYFELLRVFDHMVQTPGKPYYDALGNMYELLASQSKKSSLGQFFTPEPIIEVLVQLTLHGKKDITGKGFMDPTCGSGRMLYVGHHYAPGNFHFGIDIDPLCAKMSVLNMMMHGCVGEVVCGDYLLLHNDWRFAFAINPLLTHHGIPTIKPIKKEHSSIWTHNESWLKSFAPNQVPGPRQSQLTIF